jgi:CTP synthase (UTP-ammonia lyase)
MSLPPVIALVGDHDPRIVAHQAIPRALAAAMDATGSPTTWTWLPTEAVGTADLGKFAGFWLVPGSPYRSMDGALAVARWAREGGAPFLGTCGGFQHALISFARDVAGLPSADHAEVCPDAAVAVITPLACGLVEVIGKVRFAPGSLLHQAYGEWEANEGYHCRYGLASAHQGTLARHGFRFTATDDQGDVRGGELDGHRFYVGTLFQPERRALRCEAAPLVEAFVRAVAGKS